MKDRELYIRGLSIRWSEIARNSYLREIEALSQVEALTFHAPVTFFVGENGSGKSTLLEAIAVAWGFNPEGGTRNYHFSTCDTHSELCEALSLVKGAYAPGWGYFLRAESFYNVATAEEEYAKMGGKAHHYHERSHGESFLSVAQENFRQNGLYLLDEPEAALSPQRQLALLFEISECAKEESQFIIATHSPILLGLPGAEIWSFDSGPIHPCAYEDTDSYQITKLFINQRDRVLKELMT